MIDFVRCVQALVDAGVEFVIIGGCAAVLHGSAYITNDVCYSRKGDSLRRLASALAPFHPRLRDFPPEPPFVWGATTLSNGTALHFRLTSGSSIYLPRSAE